MQRGSQLLALGAHGSSSSYPVRTDVSNVLAHNGSRDRIVTFSGILRAGCYTIDSLKLRTVGIQQSPATHSSTCRSFSYPQSTTIAHCSG